MRREAASGLGKIGKADVLPILLKRLEDADPEAANATQSAVVEICKREGSGEAVLAALRDAPPSRQPVFLEILDALGGSDALEAIAQRARSSDERIRAAAVRLLANWSDAAALSPLLELAESESNSRTKAIVLRGVARLAPMAQDLPAEELVAALTRASAAAGVAEQKALLAALGELPSVPALKAAAAQLRNPQLADEAVVAVFKILEQLGPEHRVEARPVLETLKQVCKNQEVDANLEGLSLKFGDLKNLSLGATATNTDGLTPDGQGGLAALAIDGNPQTYWDEVDNQKLYGIQVRLKQAARVSLLRIQGWQQHNYAPKDFEILCDGNVIKKVQNALYQKNWLTVTLPPTPCATVELRITGYYGSSPAIRELEIYGE